MYTVYTSQDESFFPSAVSEQGNVYISWCYASDGHFAWPACWIKFAGRFEWSSFKGCERLRLWSALLFSKERWRAELLEATGPCCWSWLQEGTPEVHMSQEGFQPLQPFKQMCCEEVQIRVRRSFFRKTAFPQSFEEDKTCKTHPFWLPHKRSHSCLHAANERLQASSMSSALGLPGQMGRPPNRSFSVGISSIKHPAIGVSPWPWKPPSGPPMHYPCLTRHIFFFLFSSLSKDWNAGKPSCLLGVVDVRWAPKNGGFLSHRGTPVHHPF